jgi:hypothetical protein
MALDCAALGGRVNAIGRRLAALSRVPSGVRHPQPIPLKMTRADLPALCRDLGYTRGAEIGVWKGAYSASFCQANPALHMLCVDPWLSYPAWKDTKNKLDPIEAERFMADAYATARARLAPLNCTIVRKFSADAAASVEDASLDFTFIDGNHVLEAVTQDLELWAPKVKPGGWIGGHDFRAFTNKPTIHVIEAVRAYTKAHQIKPWFVTTERTPSFLWAVN